MLRLKNLRNNNRTFSWFRSSLFNNPNNGLEALEKRKVLEWLERVDETLFILKDIEIILNKSLLFLILKNCKAYFGTARGTNLLRPYYYLITTCK